MAGIMCAFVGRPAGSAAVTFPLTDDSNTKLLLHMNGTDASTTFTDDNSSGRTARTITANGNAQIDTAQSKYGGASGLFDGNDYLKVDGVASDLGIGSGDFTIEFWVRFSDVTPTRVIIDTRGDPQNSNGWCLYVNSGKLRWYQATTDRITTDGTLALNTWYHVAVVRSGNDHKIYIDGTQSGGTWTNAQTYVIGSASLGLWIGDNQPFPGNGHNGWLDELRISNIARYTANFTIA